MPSGDIEDGAAVRRCPYCGTLPTVTGGTVDFLHAAGCLWRVHCLDPGSVEMRRRLHRATIRRDTMAALRRVRGRRRG